MWPQHVRRALPPGTAQLLLLLLLVPMLLSLISPVTADSTANDSAPDSDGGEVTGSTLVELTDASFERLTQASTGATTGDWFIAFVAQSVGFASCRRPLLGRRMSGQSAPLSLTDAVVSFCCSALLLCCRC